MSNTVSVYNTRGILVSSGLFSDSGGWNTTSQMLKLQENIRALLMTSKGTLIGDPEYGSNLYKLLYYGNTTSTASRVRFEIQEVMEKYMSQVQINSVDVEFDNNGMNLTINYSIAFTNVDADMTLQFIKGERS